MRHYARLFFATLAVVLLVAMGFSVATPTNAAQENLIGASAAGDLSKVRTLLAANTDVNAKDAFGYTALMWASKNGHLDVVRALLVANADVNAKGSGGFTALIIASQANDLEVAQALITANADVNVKDAYGYTPLLRRRGMAV